MSMDMILFSGDTPIAKIINGSLEPLRPELIPLFLQRTGDVKAWLASRAVDAHRTNSRLLKKALRLAQKDDVSTVLSVNAATITDDYWIKPIEDRSTTYADVRYSVNRFDNLALTGNVDSFNQPPSRTPELTNIGSFEKCWRLMGGKWWMIKAGKPEELFSELLICRIAKFLKFPVAEYKPEGSYIKSLDFTHSTGLDSEHVNFESAAGIIGEESDYGRIYEMLKPFGSAVTKAYLQMCYLDALVINMDSHENNFGVLRNSGSGEVISLAPFFDHNIALVSRGYSQTKSFDRDLLIDDFTRLVHEKKETLSVRKLARRDVQKLIQGIPWKLPTTDLVSDPLEFTVNYLLKRQEELIKRNRDLIRFQDVKAAGREAR